MCIHHRVCVLGNICWFLFESVFSLSHSPTLRVFSEFFTLIVYKSVILSKAGVYTEAHIAFCTLEVCLLTSPWAPLCLTANLAAAEWLVLGRSRRDGRWEMPVGESGMMGGSSRGWQRSPDGGGLELDDQLPGQLNAEVRTGLLPAAPQLGEYNI